MPCKLQYGLIYVERYVTRSSKGSLRTLPHGLDLESVGGKDILNCHISQKRRHLHQLCILMTFHGH